ncbi:preprotein translocase subunit SecA [Pseudohongiella acticola]|jgi:preprotein translocase subunit SecA|uniref:Protein translocase subunit SecA n=1 Tax=Pseudohongiella acticola TaxID=1524254 RepID=A0A1E8CFE7_9GAMM|nr:preprotein translocase subunit SecA [Pseudohongiella acticola]OFE11133.1 preprotein translocase subunit SecA [Pseudohongiella acticola]
MSLKIFRKVFGSSNSRKLKKLHKIVRQINALEEGIQALSDEDLRGKTIEFKKRFDEGESLDGILPEAFAVVREASKRTLGLRHFDVQMIGGIVLHQGDIAEMKTGEGKTLVATLPAYLNGMSGNGVHIVTVNDYLASRDANWMRPLYEFLGLTVGVIVGGQGQQEKKAAYNASITYGTNNEFGFDYLRDNMAFRIEDKLQRKLNFAIVDEVDSILIDEARTPLIISGAAQDSSKQYLAINSLIPGLERGEAPVEKTATMALEREEKVESGHFMVDEKTRQVELTEAGHEHLEELLTQQKLLGEGESLYSAANLGLLHHIHSALKAHYLFHKDIEYIVKDGRIVLIDEHTGRTMEGRRLSEGLHQAIEAKEGLDIQSESQTLASTTFQNYFRLYNTLSGMTGTADTEAFEFKQIYDLDVVVIPPNTPMQRIDKNDLVYLSMEEKFEAIVADIKEFSAKGAPILVGTASIETSEMLSKFLNKEKIQHEVLNAKFHEKEAFIIAQAGRPGVVTIATNMAGRGTDIVLGGNWESEVSAMDNPSPEQIAAAKDAWQQRHDQVLEAGGLHIIGTERHESRRIDNQLRGRSGRQGDPGYSRFYLSLEDSLMRIFASERVKGFMQKLGMERGEAIEHGMVSKSIEKAQRKVEGRNFDIRKQLLEYDNVANDQRTIVYRQRNQVMASDDIGELISSMRNEVADEVISSHIPPQSIFEQWDIEGLEQAMEAEFAIHLPVKSWLEEDEKLYEETLREKIKQELTDAYAKKRETVGEKMALLEKQIVLQILDTLWKEHLAAMDQLRQGIFLRGYAGKNPKQEYKREAFELFQSLLSRLQHDVIRFLSHVQVRSPEEIDAIEKARDAERAKEKIKYQHAESSAMESESGSGTNNPDSGQSAQDGGAPFVREEPKLGRNDPCHCGSGKKFKHCHGKLG